MKKVRLNLPVVVAGLRAQLGQRLDDEGEAVGQVISWADCRASRVRPPYGR
jgi:hypothetical protein